MKKLQYTTNDPASSTDYLAGDNTWKTIPGGGGGVPYTGATADVDLGTHSLTADSIGIGVTAGAEKLHIDGGASTTRVKIDADNGVSRILSFRTDDVQRWALRVDGTESGSNSGADFQLRRYNDAGTHIDNPIAINRSTGNITTSQNVNGASPTEMSYLSGVTSAIQTQIDSKIGSSKSILQVTFGGAALSASQITFANFSNLAGSAGESARRLPMPTACTLNNFYFLMTTNQPASGSLVLTIRKNGADTALVITVAAGSVAGNYSNTTNSATFAAGDLMAIRFNNNATANSGGLGAWSCVMTI
jgi:hypothetical protein